jgi:2-polyprenyl-6-methoxyphenol hydroxylase-like FAD-dependent oxidoreductase
MARHGARVLVVERETRFRDRVRGEWMAPWGVAEARALGIYDALRRTCAHEPRYFMTVFGPVANKRDLPATTPQGIAPLAYYHPEAQQALLDAAAQAGAEVWRGARVREVEAGATRTVTIERDGGVEQRRARLVVCADGRGSAGRTWGRFIVKRDRDRLVSCGVVLENMPVDQDTSISVNNVEIGQIAYLFPQGRGRVRAYLMYQHDAKRLQGEGDLPRFFAECHRTGAPPHWYEGARPAGPMATFEGADSWVDHPYRDGIALIGDAAATTDPTWGQGMSLAMRDARVLRDFLCASDNWEAACEAYAAEHDRHYGVIHTVEDWWTHILMERGAEADAQRWRALPRIAQDPSRLADQLISGPDLPCDEAARRRMFGED